jgi:hypothetical protein
MTRVFFTCFVSFLLLITWLDDIYLGGQTPDDPSDGSSFSENDTYLPSKAPDLCSKGDVKDRSLFAETFRSTEARIVLPTGSYVLSHFNFHHKLGSLLYVFMSLQR